MTASGKNQPFFVVGSDRSGSTMLRLMLNEHSRLCIPPETWFLTDLMNALPIQRMLTRHEVEQALRIIRPHWRWKEWKIPDADLDACVQSLPSPTLAELIDAVFRLKSAPKPRWGDKTPGYVTELKRLHELFPGAKFVHIVRDGRDVCLSLRQTGWRGDTTWSIARYWNEYVGAGLQQGRALPAHLYLEVSYGDLVLKTEEALRMICGFLGEEFEPGMLRFYERARQETPGRAQPFHTKTLRPPRKSDLDRWKREMNQLQVLIFEAGAAEAMITAGQSLQFPIKARLVRPLFTLIDRAAVATLPVRRKIGLHLPKARRCF